MAHTKVLHGAYVDIPTPDEIISVISARSSTRKRHRIPESIQLDANGACRPTIVWDVPAGMEFELRRIVLTLVGNVPADPNSNNVLLNAAGKFVALLRSDSLIEYLQPQYGAAVQVPGVQTWSREQGPYFSTKETLQIQASGLPANGILSAYLEGILLIPADAAS